MSRRASIPPEAWLLRFPGPVSYETGVRLQEAAHAARVSGLVPDLVLALQHTPVVTLGRRGRDRYLLLGPEELQARGIALHRASRGGDVTYHAPGQWVLYPILDLNAGPLRARGYLNALEEIALGTARCFGVQAYRREGMNGAWTKQGKIAAIGFHLRKWVSLHGMSFNVDLDLSGFEAIVPCGLTGERVASLKTVLGRECPSMENALAALAQEFSVVIPRRLSTYTVGQDAPAAWRRIEEAARVPAQGRV